LKNYFSSVQGFIVPLNWQKCGKSPGEAKSKRDSGFLRRILANHIFFEDSVDVLFIVINYPVDAEVRYPPFQKCNGIPILFILVRLKNYETNKRFFGARCLRQ
jgi:hypothetical protein